MTGGRMYHQALGLIDHQHILVLVNNIQFHLGGRNIHRLGFGQGNGDLIPQIQFVIFLTGLATAQNTTLFQQFLRRRSGHSLHIARQKGIQTFPGNIRKQGHFFFSSFQNSLLKKIRWHTSKIPPQVIKQSATLNTGNSMNSSWIISTT